MHTPIDLRSDTVTRPSPAMRAIMAAAEVGDDVFGDDPSVLRLEARAAQLLGKEDGLFFPSGTMANLAAAMAQTRAGDTIILSEEAHMLHYEGANIARFAGLLARPLAGTLGKFDPEDVARILVQKDDPHCSPMTLVAVENTVNRGGGACYTVAEMEALGRYCHGKGLRLHCDGARLFNAAIALNADAAALAAPCDSVSVCLSKGLGAPVGSVLASDRATIHEARRCRKQLGGGMRQAGILAAAGLHALEHHVAGLADDHRRAKAFRTTLEEAGVRFPMPSPTNIVIFDSPNPQEQVDALARRGVLMVPFGAGRIRAVFHRDISDEDLSVALRHSLAVLGSS
jgi:threonine aldolase